MDAEARDEIVEILTALENLQGTDFARKNAALRLREVAQTASDHDIRNQYCSLEWWGGSGSMADFIPDGAENRRNYCRLLVHLAGVFDAAGYPCPHATKWVGVFQKWLNDGVV